MKKILITSSSPVVRDAIVREILPFSGCIIKASSADLALRILEQNTDFDLVIADMDLDDVNGRELIRLIRQTDSLSEIPIIIASGPIKIHEASELLEMGAAYFVPKPIRKGNLTQYAAQILVKKKVEKE